MVGMHARWYENSLHQKVHKVCPRPLSLALHVGESSSPVKMHCRAFVARDVHTPRACAFLPPASFVRSRGTQHAKRLAVSRNQPFRTVVRAAVDDAVSRAAWADERISAFTTLDAEYAYQREGQVKGNAPLHGAPVAVKDNLCTKGMSTTSSSAILQNFVPAYSATAVRRLEEGGGLVFAKTNMDEHGMGSSTETSAYGPTKNPWDLSRVPGGSSGGSAAAVAAGVCEYALGSDTGGSIRLPASFCGVTGLKPSYGRVSRHGLLAYASSLDTIGPITRSARDAAKVLQLIAGYDPLDATTSRAAVPDYTSILDSDDIADLSGLKIGILAEAMTDGVDSSVVEAVTQASRALEGLGASVTRVSLPSMAAATAAYYVLAPSEASANLARYDGVRYGERSSEATTSSDVYTLSRAHGFGQEVKRRIMVGTFALSSGYYDAYYRKAQQVRGRVQQDFQNLFASGLDALICPVAPTTAFRIGAKVSDPLSMYLVDLMTIPASLAGLPALSVPCGLCPDGMPIGMQVIGPYLDEAVVLKVGHAYQTATSHHEAISPIAKELSTAI